MKMTNVSQALANVATEVFLRLDDNLFRACQPIEVRPRSSKTSELCKYATWKPKDALFFTLIKLEKDVTVVFCHANGTAYFASPAARLASDCPPYTSFLCQWCLDREGAAMVPRLLVFDAIVPGCSDNANVAARGERLRSLARCLPQPMCVVQWSGEPAALDGFVRGLPHPVECILSLSEDPHKLYRHMHVDIPQCPMGDGASVKRL